MEALPATLIQNHSFKPNDYFRGHNSRSSSKLHKEQACKNHKKYSVKFKACEIRNNLPILIKNSKSVGILKKKN